MAGKYEFIYGYSIRGSVEPDGSLSFDGSEGIEDFDDESRFDSETVSIDGGQFTFIVEAESEDEARSLAERATGYVYFSDNTMDWEVEDLDLIEVKVITPPMDQERALMLVRTMTDRLVVAGTISTEEQTAMLFLLDVLTP